jgi:hypothetical protein
MRRITVSLEDDALEALVELGERERRDPRDQASILLAAAIGDAMQTAILDEAEAALEAAIAGGLVGTAG